MRVFSLVLFLMTVNVCAAQAHSFTNHAGFVLSGELSAFSGNAVTIGKERVPLTIFPEREQRRICALAGHPRVPRDVRLAIAGCRDAAERSRERARKGIIKEEVAKRRQEKADQALSAYLKKLLADGTLLEEEYRVINCEILRF